MCSRGDSEASPAHWPDAAVSTVGRGELVTTDAADSALLSVADRGGERVGGDSRYQLGEQTAIGAARTLVTTGSEIVAGHLFDDHPTRTGPGRCTSEPEEADASSEALHGVAAVGDAGDVDLSTWFLMEDIGLEAVEDAHGLRLAEGPA